jgi:hypothetical protein
LKTNMSAYQDLATAAPKVEAATVDQAPHAGSALATAALPSEDCRVDAAEAVDAAVTYDDPKKFAPAFTKDEIAHLSVAALRGSGSEFESEAGVVRGGVSKNMLQICLPCIFDERQFVAMGEVTRFVFVKGNCIFVYGQETDPSPLYAIPLETVQAVMEDLKRPDKHSITISPRTNTNYARENLVTILLRDRTTCKHAYQFTFDVSHDKSVAKRFLDLINFVGKTAGAQVVTASVMEHQHVGEKTEKQQSAKKGS